MLEYNIINGNVNFVAETVENYFSQFQNEIEFGTKELNKIYNTYVVFLMPYGTYVWESFFYESYGQNNKIITNIVEITNNSIKNANLITQVKEITETQ